MKRTLRLAALLLVAFGALGFAGNAFATQRIAVTQTNTSLTIKVSQDQSDAQPAKITIYVPTGYQLNATQAPGTKIGTTTGQVFARDANLPLPLQGDVIVADPAQHTKDACSPGTHIAVWLLNLSVAGQTISLPVYVTATSGTEAGLGPAKMEVCLGPADVPQGTPGRSPNGAQLLEATFTVQNTITPPTGPARWISFWIPYSAGTGVPNAAGTVEARSIVGPGAVTLSAKILNKKKKIVRLSGRVTQSGDAASGAKVQLMINSRSRFSTKSNASGGFVFRLQNTNRRVTTTFFQAIATAAARDVTATGCANPTQAPIPCVSATAGGFTVRSKKVKVRV
jgi:hypothetical protein